GVLLDPTRQPSNGDAVSPWSDVTWRVLIYVQEIITKSTLFPYITNKSPWSLLSRWGSRSDSAGIMATFDKVGSTPRRSLHPVTPPINSHDTQDYRHPEDKELINDMIVPLLHQWTKANALFKPPVINQCRTIELKLTKLWHKAVETSLGKGNLARKNEFLHTLDTLFDILTCKCSIQLCSESNCSHSGKRENNSHIDCGCPREKKIPVLELEFIKAQRTKAEGQGSMQMGSIDYSETKKQIANAKKREQIREREQKKKMKSEEAIQREEELCQDVYHFFDSSSDEQEATSDDIPPINVNATKLSELVDLSLEVLEPPLTTSLTSQELRNLKETPMQVPKWPSHTQSVERCVKMVTEAAGHVYSHERREASTNSSHERLELVKQEMSIFS
ncbi:hypothetical protein Hamer_G030759, partial [Homarus americanus]